MQTQLNEKQISKLREVEKQFTHLNKDDAEYALDKLLSCVNLISGVDNCFSQLCLTYLINNVYRGIDKYPLLWYNKV